MTLDEIYACMPKPDAKAVKAVDAMTRRHGPVEGIARANSYAKGLEHGATHSKPEAKTHRRHLHLECLGSIDGQRIAAGGKAGFSLTNMAIHLLESASAFVDYSHSRKFPHQVVEVNGVKFMSCGVEPSC